MAQWDCRLTPGLTRRASDVITDKLIMRGTLVRGRVHALVRPPVIEVVRRALTTSMWIIQRSSRSVRGTRKRGGDAAARFFFLIRICELMQSLTLTHATSGEAEAVGGLTLQITGEHKPRPLVRCAGSESGSSGCYARLAMHILWSVGLPSCGFGRF
jgi:hypothetical protein